MIERCRPALLPSLINFSFFMTFPSIPREALRLFHLIFTEFVGFLLYSLPEKVKGKIILLLLNLIDTQVCKVIYNWIFPLWTSLKKNKILLPIIPDRTRIKCSEGRNSSTLHLDELYQWESFLITVGMEGRGGCPLAPVSLLLNDIKLMNKRCCQEEVLWHAAPGLSTV